MKKTLVSFSDRVFSQLDERVKSGKRSEYINNVIDRHWRAIDTAITVLRISGLSNRQIKEATDVNLSSLPVVGQRAKAMARQLPDVGALADGNEAVAFAISLIAEELRLGNIALEERLNHE